MPQAVADSDDEEMIEDEPVIDMNGEVDAGGTEGTTCLLVGIA